MLRILGRYDSGKEIPWDVRKEQPALAKAEQDGLVKGLVLDAGKLLSEYEGTGSCALLQS